MSRCEREQRTGAHRTSEAVRDSDDTTFSLHANATDVSTDSSRDGYHYEIKKELDVVQGDDDEKWLGGQGWLADESLTPHHLVATALSHSRVSRQVAKLLATMLFITVGTAVDCQVTLLQSMRSSAGAYPSQNWAWGLAVASTIYLSGVKCRSTGVLSCSDRFWARPSRTPSTWLPSTSTKAVATFEHSNRFRRAQYGTPVCHAAAVRVRLSVRIWNLGDGDEHLDGDGKVHAPPSDGLSELVLGLVVVRIGMSLAWPTSYAISPELGSGTATFSIHVGWGRELCTHNACWWLYRSQAATGTHCWALCWALCCMI